MKIGRKIFFSEFAGDKWPLSPVHARREPQRGPETHYRGALSQPHSVCAEIETLKGGKGGNVGRVSPHHPTRRLGEYRKLPQRSPGRSPGRKWISCIFEVRKKPCGTPFSVFLSDGGAPPNVAGPGKSSPFSTGLLPSHIRLCPFRIFGVKSAVKNGIVNYKVLTINNHSIVNLCE